VGNVLTGNGRHGATHINIVTGAVGKIRSNEIGAGLLILKDMAERLVSLRQFCKRHVSSASERVLSQGVAHFPGWATVSGRHPADLIARYLEVQSHFF
jgi:hypothetical protein